MEDYRINLLAQLLATLDSVEEYVIRHAETYRIDSAIQHARNLVDVLIIDLSIDK